MSISGRDLMPGVQAFSAYVCVRKTCAHTRTGYFTSISTISTLSSLDVLALKMGSSPRNNLKRCSHVYDAVRGNNGNNAGSPEGTTTLKEKSAVFRDGYRSRPVRAENVGSVLCDTRGKLSPKPPTRSAKGARSRCTTTDGSFVL